MIQHKPNRETSQFQKKLKYFCVVYIIIHTNNQIKKSPSFKKKTQTEKSVYFVKN